MHQPSSIPISDVINTLLMPGNFYVGGGLDLTCTQAEAEDVSWEIFHGRLLDPAQTRERKSFRSWKVYLVENRQRSAEPILSVKWDKDARQIYVTRGLHCHVWEAYDSGDNVILTRETTKWVRELVGTVFEADFEDSDELRSELADLLFRAVVGTSRLPLNPVEAPLPAFSLGQMAFFDTAAAVGDRLMRCFRQLIKNALSSNLPWQHAAKLLEFSLRVVPAHEVAEAARLFAEHWPTHRCRTLADFPRLFRTMFNEVSLSPYTTFVDNALRFLQAMVDLGSVTVESQIDLLSYLLRQVCRHLTAYDLITFHHRGANYPDALLLDAVLKAYVRLIEANAELFSSVAGKGRLRRRALRQACLLRRFYEGHPVPDAPTSPGENVRVLPPPHARVPEEHLLEPRKRRKQLYAGEPTLQLLGEQAGAILQESLRDLNHADELRELGMAIFIDRPLGMGKKAGEPDQTPLLSHEAFSRSIAERRLTELLHFDAALSLDTLREQLRALPITGYPATDVLLPDRPVVSLADARRVAEDFVFLRTLPESARQLFGMFDMRPLLASGLNFSASARLLIVTPADRPGIVAVYDEAFVRRMELEADLTDGFRVLRGIEVPARGLRVLHSATCSCALAAGR